MDQALVVWGQVQAPHREGSPVLVRMAGWVLIDRWFEAMARSTAERTAWDELVMVVPVVLAGLLACLCIVVLKEWTGRKKHGGK